MPFCLGCSDRNSKMQEHIKGIERDSPRRKALDSLENEKDVEYYVCQHCGNVIEKILPDLCPICSSTKSMYLGIS